MRLAVAHPPRLTRLNVFVEAARCWVIEGEVGGDEGHESSERKERLHLEM